MNVAMRWMPESMTGKWGRRCSVGDSLSRAETVRMP